MLTSRPKKDTVLAGFKAVFDEASRPGSGYNHRQGSFIDLGTFATLDEKIKQAQKEIQAEYDALPDDAEVMLSSEHYSSLSMGREIPLGNQILIVGAVVNKKPQP